MGINIDFNFQAETLDKNGKERDSDKYSSTLQEYHRILWSKPLPGGGELFKLTKISDNRLYHNSHLGEFYLSSDWGVATLNGWQRTKAFISEVDSREINEFERLVTTIGARIIWPSNKIGALPTINSARGFNYYIGDRLDLTIECIRLYYLNEPSPLYETLKRYNEFFALFVDFKGYVDFFLFQDAVSLDYKSVNIVPPFDNFKSSPVPRSADEYYAYMQESIKFIKARNKRIANYIAQ